MALGLHTFPVYPCTLHLVCSLLPCYAFCVDDSHAAADAKISKNNLIHVCSWDANVSVACVVVIILLLGPIALVQMRQAIQGRSGNVHRSDTCLMPRDVGVDALCKRHIVPALLHRDKISLVERFLG